MKISPLTTVVVAPLVSAWSITTCTGTDCETGCTEHTGTGTECVPVEDGVSSFVMNDLGSCSDPNMYSDDTCTTLEITLSSDPKFCYRNKYTLKGMSLIC